MKQYVFKFVFSVFLIACLVFLYGIEHHARLVEWQANCTRDSGLSSSPELWEDPVSNTLVCQQYCTDTFANCRQDFREPATLCSVHLRSCLVGCSREESLLRDGSRSGPSKFVCSIVDGYLRFLGGVQHFSKETFFSLQSHPMEIVALLLYGLSTYALCKVSVCSEDGQPTWLSPPWCRLLLIFWVGIGAGACFLGINRLFGYVFQGSTYVTSQALRLWKGNAYGVCTVVLAAAISSLVKYMSPKSGAEELINLVIPAPAERSANYQKEVPTSEPFFESPPSLPGVVNLLVNNMANGCATIFKRKFSNATRFFVAFTAHQYANRPLEELKVASPSFNDSIRSPLQAVKAYSLADCRIVLLNRSDQYDLIVIEVPLKCPSYLGVKPADLATHAESNGRINISYFTHNWFNSSGEYRRITNTCIVKHNAYTTGGASGSGIFIKRGGRDFFFGVHHGGWKDEEWNKAVVIVGILNLPEVNIREGFVPETSEPSEAWRVQEDFRDYLEYEDGLFIPRNILNLIEKAEEYVPDKRDTVEYDDESSSDLYDYDAYGYVSESALVTPIAWNLSDSIEYINRPLQVIFEPEQPPTEFEIVKVGDIKYIADMFQAASKPKLSEFQRRIKEYKGVNPLAASVADFSNPMRGCLAEMNSVRFQLGRQVVADSFPRGAVSRALDRMMDLYPNFKFVPLATQAQRKAKIIQQMTYLKPTASPGIPMNQFSDCNADLLKNHAELLASSTLALLNRFMDENLTRLSTIELVKQGLVPLPKLHVKQEPHKEEKVKQGRYRIIFGGSVVFQLMERVVMYETTKFYNSQWQTNPNKPGIGFTDEMIADMDESLRDMLIEYGVLISNDVSGWDFSLRKLLMYAGGLQFCKRKSPQWLHLFWKNYFHVIAKFVFVNSDGEVWMADDIGVMKSGLFLTSFLNSILRVFLSLVTAYDTDPNCQPKAGAMGDDCFEDGLTKRDYAKYGFRITDTKETKLVNNKFHVEFCSHRFTGEGVAPLLSFPKATFRLLSGGFRAENFAQFKYEIRHCPEYDQILDLLREIGYIPLELHSPLCDSYEPDGGPGLNLLRNSMKSKQSKKTKEVRKEVSEARRELKTIAGRTISNQDAAKLQNDFVKRSRESAIPKYHPNQMLTPEEASYHSALKSGDQVPFLIESHNIEPSIVKQKYTAKYLHNSSVAANSTYQISVNSSAGNGVDSQSLKSFSSPILVGVGSAGGFGLPGPAATGSIQASAVIAGALTAPSVGTVALQTTAPFVGGFSTLFNPVTSCPFTAVADEGEYLRWQLVGIRIRLMNTTIGSNRGGMAYLIQTDNSVVDGSPTKPISYFMNKGIFKAFQDMTIGSVKKPVSLNVRPGLSNFVSCTTATSTNTLDHAALFVMLDNQTSADQTYTMELELDWVLAGTAVHGIGSPHIVPKSVSDRASTANAVMRAANIVPSEQSGKENIPAVLSLNQDPAMQAVFTNASGPLPRVNIHQHPLVKATKEMVGKHAESLLQAGVHGLVHIASRAVSAADALFA